MEINMNKQAGFTFIYIYIYTYDKMAIWLRECPRWMSTAKATKMQQSSEDGIKF